MVPCLLLACSCNGINGHVNSDIRGTRLRESVYEEMRKIANRIDTDRHKETAVEKEISTRKRNPTK